MAGDLDCDAVIVGSGPGGSTVAEVLTAAGWSVIVLEKGRNHLLSLDPPFELAGDLSNDEIKFQRRHFLGPDPFLEPRTYRRSTADGERLFAGEVNNLPSTVGGGGFHADAKLPRFREEDFHLRSDAAASTVPRSRTGRVQYEDLEPHYALAEQLIGVAGDATPIRSRRGAAARIPCRRGRTCSAPSSRRRPRLERGLHPYRAPTGVNSVPYDGRPACNNCGFCGGYGCADPRQGRPRGRAPASAAARVAARSGPRPTSARSCSTVPAASATGVRYLDVAAGNAAREVRAAHVVLAAGAFETPRLLLRIERRQLVRARRPQPHVPLPDLHRRRLPVLVARRTRPQRDPPARRLHGARHRGDGGRAAADLPWIRGGTVEHGGGGSPIMEATTYPTRTAAQPLDARLGHPRSPVGVHDAGGGPPAADEPHRPRSVGGRRVGLPRRAGHVRRRTATSSSRPSTSRPCSKT